MITPFTPRVVLINWAVVGQRGSMGRRGEQLPHRQFLLQQRIELRLSSLVWFARIFPFREILDGTPGHSLKQFCRGPFWKRSLAAQKVDPKVVEKCSNVRE